MAFAGIPCSRDAEAKNGSRLGKGYLLARASPDHPEFARGVLRVQLVSAARKYKYFAQFG